MRPGPEICCIEFDATASFANNDAFFTLSNQWAFTLETDVFN